MGLQTLEKLSTFTQTLMAAISPKVCYLLKCLESSRDESSAIRLDEPTVCHRLRSLHSPQWESLTGIKLLLWFVHVCVLVPIVPLLISRP